MNCLEWDADLPDCPDFMAQDQENQGDQRSVFQNRQLFLVHRSAQRLLPLWVGGAGSVGADAPGGFRRRFAADEG